MQSLQDLLGITDYQDDFEDAKAGNTPNSQWDVDLPLTNEYRLSVEEASYGPSKASGKNQIVLTFAVVEPVEFAGAKFQEYISPNPTNTVGSQILAKMFGALQASFDGYGPDDLASFVKQFEGRTVVAALRKWGENEDRTSTRWVNLDKGQALKTDVKPPKSKGGNTTGLTADINIPKQETVAPPITIPTADPAPAQQPLPGVNLPGGPNLPPGLRG